MKTIYLNMKTNEGVETVDEFRREPGQNLRDFLAYVRKMVSEYHLAGLEVYRSSRPARHWETK